MDIHYVKYKNSKGWLCNNFPLQFHFFLGAIHEKHKFKYFKNLTVKVCKIWCNDVYTVQLTAYTDKCWAFKRLNIECWGFIGGRKSGLIISFITLTCTDGQQLNKQYDHNDFQVDVPGTIGVSKIYLSMYVWFVTLVTFYLVEIFT